MVGVEDLRSPVARDRLLERPRTLWHRQVRTLRVHQSSIATKYTKPRVIGTQAMSAVTWLTQES